MANEPTSSQPAAAITDPADRSVELIRSEEQLQVGTRVRVSGRAVLRKYVVTETVTQTFEVRREEVRLDYEPVADGDVAAPDGPAFDDRIVEVVLHREVPRVELEVVAVERVRIHTDTVTTEVAVSSDVEKEQIELDLPQQQHPRVDGADAGR